MALHTKKEFAEKCGMATNGLSVYISRRKIILSGDYVDDSIEQNSEFLKKRQEKITGIVRPVTTLPKKQPRSVPAGEIKPPVYDTPDAPNVEDPDFSYQDMGITALEKKKKALDIQKIGEEIEILKVKKDKLHGVVIPTELIKALLINHSESLKIAYIDASESLLVKIAAKKQLTRPEVAELKGENIKIINRAVDNAINASKKNIKNIVKEFSGKRGKGERT